MVLFGTPLAIRYADQTFKIMKRIAQLFLLFVLMLSVPVSSTMAAKDPAKKARKEIKKKAAKDARKEAKRLKRKGWYVAPGALPLSQAG